VIGILVIGILRKKERGFLLCKQQFYHRRILCMRTFNRNGMSLSVSQGGPVVGRVFKAADRGLVVAQRQAKMGRCNHKPWVHPTISDAACLGHRVE
jgi:phage terminase large subunit-like protein